MKVLTLKEKTGELRMSSREIAEFDWKGAQARNERYPKYGACVGKS